MGKRNMKLMEKRSLIVLLTLLRLAFSVSFSFGQAVIVKQPHLVQVLKPFYFIAHQFKTKMALRERH